MKLKKEVRKQMKRSIIATILAATVLISMAGMASAAGTWYLNNDSVMYQDGSNVSGYVPIGIGGSNVWLAEYATPDAINFNGSTVTMLITALSCTVQIGYSNGSNSNFTAGSSTQTLPIYPGSPVHVEFDDVNFTVPAGNYLAINVTNTGESALIVETKGVSTLHYYGPAVYPTPEFATFALVGIGLIGLVALGRRRT